MELMPLDKIQRAKNNPKRHDIPAIMRSMALNGFGEAPMLDERTQRLVAGHGRLEALVGLRLAKKEPPKGVVEKGKDWLVPIQRGWASKNDAEAKAYLVASNRTTELGGWDDSELSEMLSDIAKDGAETLAAAGYDGAELEKMLSDANPAEPDEAPTVPEKSWVKTGDMFQLGEHRLLCGDCRSDADVARLFGDKRANVAFTSPPYASQRKYDETSAFKPIRPDAFVAWFDAVSACVLGFLAEDGSWFVNIKEHCDDGQRSLYVKDLVVHHVRDLKWRLVDELCWRNTKNGVPGGWPNRFKNAWEPVFHFSRSMKIKFNPEAVSSTSDAVFDYSPSNNKSVSGSGLLGQDKESGFRSGLARPSNVLEIPAESSSGEHSAPFPVALPSFFIKAFSDLGDVIYDPFMGSGTTLIAAEMSGRIALGCEISPAYSQCIIERWEKFTGKKHVKL